MEYIAHKRFKSMAACKRVLNIPYGTKLESIGRFIATPDGKAVCFTTSENAHKYFSRNDDDNGLERGALTYAIAYEKRPLINNKISQFYRFSNEEIKLLESHWKHFLRDDVDVILFNHEFFNADIWQLRELARQLKIKVR